MERNNPNKHSITCTYISRHGEIFLSHSKKMQKSVLKSF